jgi:hypothetical protein
MWNWLNPLCNITPNPTDPNTGQPVAIDCGIASPQNWADPRCWASSPVSGAPSNTSPTTMMLIAMGAIVVILLIRR